MANLTPEELEQLRSPVLPPANLPLGSGTPLAGMLDLDAMNVVNGIDPIAQLGQNLGIDQFGQPQAAMPEIDLSDKVEPLPYDPAQPSGVVPSPETKLAAAEVVLGQDEQQPSMINQVVGKTTKSTSQTEKSQESKDAASALEQAQADSKAASDLELKAAKDQADIDAKISKEDADVINSVETARVAAQQQSQARFQQDLSDIDAKVAELANFKPETFWGSKSTADKLTAALSVGLGAYGQALLGSGSNIGQVLLERNMKEFDQNQNMIYQAKLKQIDGMKGSLDMKRSLAMDAEKTFDAQKLAARAQVTSQNAKALAMAKTPTVQAAIQQRQAKFDADIASKQAEIASKYEAKSTETTENDIIKQVLQTPGMGKDGKPLKLTEGQAKARVALADVASANQALKGVNVDKLAESPAYQTFLRSANNERNFASVPFIGGAMKGIGDTLTGTNEQYLAKQDPELAKMNAAIASWTRGIIRYKSGASIAVKEEADERNQYWPALGDTPESLKDKARARAEIEKAMRQAGDL